MALWWGLIIIPLIGIVWVKSSRQNSTKTSFVSEADLLPNDEYVDFDSTEIWAKKEASSATASDANASTFLGDSLHKSDDASLKDLISEHSSADADSLPEDNADSLHEDGTVPPHEGDANAVHVDGADPRHGGDADPPHDAEDALLEDVLDEASFLSGGELQSVSSTDECCSDKLSVASYGSMSRTIHSLIENISNQQWSINKPAKLERKADLYEDTVLPKRRCFINLDQCNYDLVWSIAQRFGMRKSLNDWDIMWIDVEAGTKSKQVFTDTCLKMKEHQLINHFPGFWSLSSKDLLVRNWQRMQKHFPNDYHAFPRSWILPRDALQLSIYARNHKWVFFIAKPTDSCAGHGILVTRELQVDCRRKMVYQLYVRPFLIDGYKFDFRVYVLVTSCDPLRIYVHNEGLARFATVKYEEPTKENCGNVFMHLTNSCVNTRNPSFVKDEFHGHSRRISTVLKWLQDNDVDSGKIRQLIDDAIIKTVIAVIPTIRHNCEKYFPLDVHQCFEIMGFDLMLDYELNIYVLEVNASPSFGSITHTTYEAEIKASVVRDTFRILQGTIVHKLKNKKSARKPVDKSIQAIFEWEKSHLGDFRMVYPPVPSLGKYYQKFIDKGISMRYNLT